MLGQGHASPGEVGAVCCSLDKEHSQGTSELRTSRLGHCWGPLSGHHSSSSSPLDAPLLVHWASVERQLRADVYRAHGRGWSVCEEAAGGVQGSMGRKGGG